MYGPASLPTSCKNRLSQAIAQVVESENFKKRAEDQGAKAIAMNSDELGKLGAKERSMWNRHREGGQHQGRLARHHPALLLLNSLARSAVISRCRASFI